MKGWQNQYDITQKVNRNDDNYLQRINYFENNEYLITKQILDHIDYRFPQQECFSLHQLIESMNYNFTKIYKGQLLIIILEVLKHVQQLHQQKLSHGKLIPQNIFIQLKNDKNKKLTILQTKFTIKKVYFINYSIIDDSNYQLNYVQDINQIIDCFIQFIQAFQNQQCQLFKTICNILNEYKNNIKEDDLNKLIEFFNLLIQDCVDLQQQKLKKSKINISMKLNESIIQEIKYEEGEEYGYLSKRYRGQTTISNFIDYLNQQGIIYELNNEKNNVGLVELFDISQLSLDGLKIFNVFESIIKQQMMKIIWNRIGAYLESWDQNQDLIINVVLKEINQANKNTLNDQLSILLKEFNNINSLNKQIQEEIEQYYKFQIKYDEQKPKDQFILELQIQSQNYSFQDFQSFIHKIKSNVLKELKNYYDQVVMIEILLLINDLI